MRQLRMSNDLADAVTAWAGGQEGNPNWSEAARRLIELGLAGSRPAKPRRARGAAKARDMAAHAVDQLADPAAPVEEQIARKKRLLKGPGEFRDMRVDLPKPRRIK